MANDPSQVSPAAVEANHRGVELVRQDRLREAAAAFDEACTHAPDYAEAHSNLGAVLRRLGDPDGAIDCYRKAVRARPDFAPAHYNLGNALALAGNADDAMDAYRSAVEAKPDYAEAWNNLARLLNDDERHEEALAACEKGLAADPDNANLHNNAGNALRGLGRTFDAADAYQRAIALAPDLGEAHSNLGVVLKESQDVAQSLAAHEKAVELRPDDISTLNNYGSALQAADRTEDAIEIYRRALAIAPEAPSTLLNLGTSEMAANRVEQAIATFERALASTEAENDPSVLALAHKNLGLSLLLQGDFPSGTKHYHWRWETREFTRPALESPEWDGSTMPDKSLFIHAEQGLGDAIQFSRLVALARPRCGEVVVEAPPSLVTLLASAEGVDRIVAEGGTPPSTDFHIASFDLLGALGIALDRVPADVPYLFVDKARRERWIDRIPDTGRRRIGLVWAGRPTHRNDRNRSIPLTGFRPLLSAADTDFYSLQVGDRAGDIRAAGLTNDLLDLAPFLGDFAETAAAVERLDLLISVDTAVVHLAGALGRPTWVLVPFAPDWRWMLGRDDSPWYPTLRLFRQESPQDWPPVIERVRRALAAAP